MHCDNQSDGLLNTTLRKAQALEAFFIFFLWGRETENEGWIVHKGQGGTYLNRKEWRSTHGEWNESDNNRTYYMDRVDESLG